MLTITTIIKAFLKGIWQSKIALTGAIITTILFPVLVVYAVLEGLGIIENPQIGFIVYGGLTWLFVAGHIMVFIGLFILRNKKATPLFSADDFRKHFSESTRFNSIRKLILFVSFVTFFNFLVILVTSYNGFHYSESVDFCAKLCHTVMMPEYTAYQNSPHSRVACVECHIGTGAKWFAKSKLSGARQLLAVTLGTYSQPIMTPVHGLRPVRETCEECHRLEFFHGDKLKVIDKFRDDEANTHVQTVLLMKIGSGGYQGREAQGIHWHVSPENKIIYKHSDWKRENITEVKLIEKDRPETVFFPDAMDEAEPGSHEGGGIKVMDCVDCHNRPTHIYLAPEDALDQKLMTGEIPRDLPYIKKQAMEVVTRDYINHDEAREEISRQLHAWYNENYPELMEQKPFLLEKAIKGVTQAYTENVFPEMNIGYGTYNNYLGHRDESGCFRCHDDSHENKDGETISQDCETCHLILAEEEPTGYLELSEEESSENIKQILQGNR